MKYTADMHIHSALSPCASNDMTPNNIVNTAYLNKLDIIAVTDHNSVENLPAVESCARERGILLVPGMELETSEEIHVLCYLPDIQKAFELQKHVYDALPAIKNRVDIFGEQLILDSSDNVTGTCERMLVTACSLSIQEVFTLVNQLGGAAVPAHINRNSYSILSNLGYIPEELGVTSLELDIRNIEASHNNESYQKIKNSLHNYNIICSSDSHSLESIFEYSIYIEEFNKKNLEFNLDFNFESVEKNTQSVISSLKRSHKQQALPAKILSHND